MNAYLKQLLIYSSRYSIYSSSLLSWFCLSSLIFSENQCPLTFEQPPAVFESRTLTLTCSTSSSCPSNLRIQDLTSLHPTHIPDTHPNEKRTSVSFVASWMDDGKVFSCQTQDNMDKHLIRNISISVECKFMNGVCWSCREVIVSADGVETVSLWSDCTEI